MTDDIKTDVALMLGLKELSAADERIIDMIVTQIVEDVKAYCRIDTLPQQLKGLVAQMAVTEYRRGGYGSVEHNGQVASISEGARSVSFKVVDTQALIDCYERRLRPYRNIRARLPSEVE